MFTVNDLDNALPEVRGLQAKSLFCAEKSLISYRLSRMSRNYRGKTIEIMVKNYLKKLGKKVFHIGNSCSFDMIVDGYKVEIKSSLAVAKTVRGVMEYKYKFGHICPSNFHKLILVFISPENVDCRILDSRTVAKYLGVKYTHKDLRVGKKILGKVLAA